MLRPDQGVMPLRDEVDRPRLIHRLARRWHVPIVVIEAPGGYGKSVVLAQARRANSATPSGLDLHVACRPAERDATQLAARILDLIQRGVAPVGDTDEALAEMVASAMAGLAPTPVSLMLDDLHHLGEDSGSVAFLRALVRTLPTNAHLVLAGRSLPDLPLARLRAADGVVEIGSDELEFDHAESRALAAQHDVDADAIEMSVGWPALVRLSLVVGKEASLDFLIEEIVHDLDARLRQGLTAAVLATGADDELLAAVIDVTPPLTGAELIESVPLVAGDGDGVRPHDLWRDALDRIVDADVRHRIGARVARWLSSRGNDERALDAAAGAGAWDEAQAAILTALESGDAQLTASLTARWQSMFPTEQIGEPTLCLLRGATARMGGDIERAKTELDRALAGFAEQSNGKGRAAAALERGLVAWLEGDVATVLELVAVGEQLAREGIESMAWMVTLSDVVILDLSGRPAEALAALDGIDVAAIPDTAAALVLRWRTTLHILLGQTANAVQIADQLSDLEPGAKGKGAVALVHWQHGDPTPTIDLRERAADRLSFDNARDDFVSLIYGAFIAASFGETIDLSMAGALATDRSRDQTMVALATAVSLVARGSESEAASVLATALDSIGIDDPLCRGELRRFVSLTAVLSPDVVELMETDPPPGKLAERFRLAQLLLRLRAGQSIDWNDLPSPADVLTGLPLPWAVELAAGATAAGSEHGPVLAEYLVDVTRSRARELLEELAGHSTPGADALLAAIPRRPTSGVRVTACGPLAVSGPEITDDDLLRRARVRELLALLVLRDRITVARAAELLWPALDPDSRKNNLRTTVSYLRRLLEPNRPPQDPPFHVRRRGEDLWLERSEQLDVDVWRLQRSIRQGRELERGGQVAAAMAHHRRAIDAWTGDLLADLRHHDELRDEVTLLDREVADAAARVAQWSAATGDHDHAEAVAERLLRHDRYDERAHAVIIGSNIERGELQAAGAALERCREALAEIGSEPSTPTAMLIRRLEQRTGR